MSLFKEFIVIESEKSSQREISHTIDTVNSLYNEWRKVKRRINAVDIASTTANKIGNISPDILPHLHSTTRDKLAILCMRCLDYPRWKPIMDNQRIFKKLYPIIDKLQNQQMHTGTGGTLKDVILTRMSASYCYQNKLEDGTIVFVSYEPQPSGTYMRYLFGSEQPNKTYTVSSLTMPETIEKCVKIISVDHEKAVKKYSNINN